MLSKDDAARVSEYMEPSMQIQNEISLSDLGLAKIPRLIVRPDGSCFFDPSIYCIHLGYYTPLEVFRVESDEEFMAAMQYLREHEEAHCRYTAQQPYAWGIQRGCEVVLEYIAAKELPTKKRFRSNGDYINFVDVVLPSKGIYISWEMLTQIVSDIENSVEDGRIERIISGTKEGVKEYIRLFRGKFWTAMSPVKKLSDKHLKEHPEVKLTIMRNQVLTLATCQLYQKGFVEAFSGTKMMSEVNAIMPYIAKGIMAERTRDMAEQSVEICRRLAPYIYETCKKAAADEQAKKELEKLLADIIKNIVDQMPSFPLTERQEKKDEARNMESLFKHSDLVVTLDDETFDKLAEMANGKGTDSPFIIRREHPDDRSGNGKQNDGESGDGGSGNGNSGDGESGDGSSGNGNSGNGESGDGSSGNGNSGNGESGDGKSGNGNSGNGESGDGKSGNGNSGNGESGDGKSGNGNSGDGESGDGKSGNGNSGNGESGDGKSGNGKQNDGESGDGKSGNGKQNDGESGDARSGSSKSGNGKPDKGSAHGNRGGGNSKSGHLSNSSGGAGERDLSVNTEAEMQAAMAAAKEIVEAIEAAAAGSIDAGTAVQKRAEVRRGVTKEERTPISRAMTDPITSAFKEVIREYKVSEKLPPEIAQRARKQRAEYEKYFRSMTKKPRRYLNSGLLDTRRIYALGMKDGDIFKSQPRPGAFDGCIYFLLDNSGSMSGEKRLQACIALAVAEESIKGLVPFKITAFHLDDDGIVHEVVKNWTESFDKNCAWNYAVNRKAEGGNDDGYDIEIATAELLARKEKKKLLIVSSDGAPSDRGHVKRAVDAARKAGIQVISMYFGDMDKEFIRAFEDMYTRDLVTCRPHEIDKNLAVLLRKFCRGK